VLFFHGSGGFAKKSRWVAAFSCFGRVLVFELFEAGVEDERDGFADPLNGKFWMFWVDYHVVAIGYYGGWYN
jgi:hypothetical protein